MSDAPATSAVADPAFAAINRFVRQVEGAAAFLVFAHSTARAGGSPVKVLAHRVEPLAVSGRNDGWHGSLVGTSASRLHDLVTLFTEHPLQGPGAPAEFEAFKMLLELTPAGPPLLALAGYDRRRAYGELRKHMDLVCRQFEAAAALADSLVVPEPVADAAPVIGRAVGAGFREVREVLLRRAGGTLTLTEAAAHLGVSRQALHKRIAAGSALGMMVDGEIVVPNLQFEDGGVRTVILDGIGRVTKLFKSVEAGPWMALQFLADADPNLGLAPIDALRQGRAEAVLTAARAHLRCDER